MVALSSFVAFASTSERRLELFDRFLVPLVDPDRLAKYGYRERYGRSHVSYGMLLVACQIADPSPPELTLSMLGRYRSTTLTLAEIENGEGKRRRGPAKGYAAVRSADAPKLGRPKQFDDARKRKLALQRERRAAKQDA